VRVALLRQGKQIKLTARAFPTLTFATDTRSMTIRITTGSLRSCVRFGTSTIRRRDSSAFVAVNAPADSLPDCSDESIGLPPSCVLSDYPACGGSCYGDAVCIPFEPGCRCVVPPGRCGASVAPTCGGTCPAGESCEDVGNECACLPEGATPCGTPNAPTCGGVCPGARVCRPVVRLSSPGGALDCGCGLPVPCGEGGIECDNGSACVLSSVCSRIPCGNGTCGGACGDGGMCSPVSDTSGSSECVCATPAPCCDGGLVCPPSQYCSFTPDTCEGCRPL
jgi:hypothetical protein